MSDIERGVEILRRGGLVAFPTETVYGLGADASNAEAVRKIFAAKGRPSGHPLIVHLARASMVREWADLDPAQAEVVDRLAEAFWPGPLTIVAPRSDLVAAETVGGRPTVGLRVPDHPVSLALLEAFEGGIAAPSANRFGRVSPTTAEHVSSDLGAEVDLIIDGGPTRIGVESTIVELDGTRVALLRPGGVSLRQLSAVLDGEVGVSGVVDDRDGEARASGMLRSHYAPLARVELVAADELAERLSAPPGSDRLGVIAPFAVEHRPSWRLPLDPEGYARSLYRSLREADEQGVDRLLIVAPDDGDLRDAVLDRLTKAAAPRPASSDAEPA